ncbi:hypothetical protein LOTGIDRAFT_205031 [Lottia gigantea]|uniref:Tyrosyl-DNA phosphodiesterase 2 n=1 Tax=Lottia gigantea TaxID=225164 RepID=V4BBY9_LOTGI|nr:hypothetical protein LOTGIDRAFT_205031 [Lottia gigantea]ESP03592.1 hypothetical protein LOTGIDRAFT_205031 [Lottia gigantea]
MSNSEEEEDPNLPSQAECLERCIQFAELTGSDRALAMFYLQDRDWDLQRSVNDYFEDNGASSPSSKLQTTVPQGASLVTTSNTEIKDDEPHRIRLLSWNIDGLDHQNLESRTKAVCQLIEKENPHVVFLQEVVPATEQMIRTSCKNYKISSAHQLCDYYSMILLHDKFTSNINQAQIFPYPNTNINNHDNNNQAQVKGVKFKFMTSHLESCKEHSEKRIAQLKLAFERMKSSDTNSTVIFGGDLNLRDPEIGKANGIPENVKDLWEVTGKRPEAKFTWDMIRNDNLEFGGKFKPKCRFDRLYYKESIPKTVKPVYFELVGLERLKSCQRFASDHWGLLTHFDKV